MAYIEMDTKIRFLIVDPAVQTATGLKTSLKNLGYANVDILDNCGDVVRAVKEKLTDFLFVSKNIEGVNAIEVFHDIKFDLKINRCAFVICDKQFDESDLLSFEELGIDGALKTPVVQKDVAAYVTKIWSKYQDTTSPNYFFELARCIYAKGDAEKAKEIFLKLAKSGNLVVSSLMATTAIQYEQGDVENALATCHKVIEKFEECVQAHELLGRIYLEKGDQDKAIQSYMRAIELSPKNPFRYQKMGDMLTKSQLWREAETLFQMGVDQGLEYAFIIEGLAASLINQGHKEKAIKHYQTLVQKFPKKINYLNNIAVCYRSLGNTGQAIAHYRKALRLEPENKRILFNLALVLSDKGKDEEAKKNLHHILVIDPSYDKARVRLKQLEAQEEAKKSA